MILYCEKCEKVVPEDEVLDFAAKFGRASKYKPSGKVHCYKQTVNAYKNQAPGTIGCYLVEETVWCGKVREPTDQEYFICNLTKSNAK